MINKRLLIKHLLAHNDENSFYDKKRKISLENKEGKAKFLKHICALSNSNPENNSYIVIGVEDEDNCIEGVDFYDDAKIQNLVNAYLSNAPIVAYENIPFPHLPDDKVVGLVTIRPNKGKICSLRKNIWKYYGGSVFFRDGSISMPKVYDLKIEDKNSEIVKAIEDHAQNNVELTLDGVFDFLNKRKDFNPRYKVFKEYFVVCWAGKKKTVKENVYYSRVDIALINEQVKLFYSELDEVSFKITDDEFQIVEYVYLGLQHQKKYYPLEEVSIKFKNNVSYDIETTLLFEPPQYDRKTLFHIYNSANILVDKLISNVKLTTAEQLDVFQLPQTYLICYFNGFEDAIIKLEASKDVFKTYDADAYSNFKDSLRILRKVKYN